MKLARLILPMRDNDFKSLTLELRLAESIMVELWGGYTRSSG